MSMTNAVRLAFLLTCVSASGPRLQDVPTLVFVGQQLIHTKRQPPVHEPEQVVCLNDGTSKDGQVRWDCTPYGLPKGHTLITEAVRCQGIHGLDDDRVLKSSCILEYRVERTPSLGQCKATGYAIEMAFAYLFWRTLSTVLGFTFDMNASGLLFGLMFILTFQWNASGLLFGLITVCVRMNV